MNTLSLSQHTIHPPVPHPPVPLTRPNLIDRAALHSGLALIRWVERSEQARGQRLLQQRERAVRHQTYELLRSEIAEQRVRLDTHMLFRSLQ